MPTVGINSEEFLEEELVDTLSDLIISDGEIEELYSRVAFRVVYQTNNFFLPQIHNLIQNREVLNIRPEYQRRLRWGAKQKSSLVESLLLNVPVPPVFLFESDLARYEVMDGQQRLNTIHSFFENDFRLVGLEKLPYINGKTYNRLPPKLKRGLDRASISAIVLLQETKSDESDPFIVRRFVFERLNTGGQKLNPQEMRNSIYGGKFNELIIRLARLDLFCEIFGIPKYTETDESEYYENPNRQSNNLYKKMGDCQIVLRFFALQNDEMIRGSMKSILDSCMSRHMGDTVDDINRLGEDYKQSLYLCGELFDGEPFVLPPDEQGRVRLSIALYDALMISVWRRRSIRQQLSDHKNEIRSALNELALSRRELLVGRANTAQAIRDRIAAVGQVIDSVL